MKKKLEDELIHEKYKELACAVIQQVVEDFLKDYKMDNYAFYKWCMECDYFDYLDLDREYFYVKVLKLKEKGITSVRRTLNG